GLGLGEAGARSRHGGGTARRPSRPAAIGAPAPGRRRGLDALGREALLGATLNAPGAALEHHAALGVGALDHPCRDPEIPDVDGGARPHLGGAPHHRARLVEAIAGSRLAAGAGLELLEPGALL